MKLVSKLIPKAGFKVYAGADISAIIDSRSLIFWSVTANLPSTMYNGVQANVIFIQQIGKVAHDVLIPLNDNNTPLINARGSLNGLGTNLYAGWDKTIDSKPTAFVYELDEIITPSTGSNFVPLHLPVAPARFVTSDENDWVVTDELIRDKFNLTDRLLNNLREILIVHGLAQA